MIKSKPKRWARLSPWEDAMQSPQGRKEVSFPLFSGGQAKLSGPGRSATGARNRSNRSAWAVRLSRLAQQEGGGKAGRGVGQCRPRHSQGARRAWVYSGSAQGGAGASCEHPVWGRGQASHRGSPGERTLPGAAAAAPWAECSRIHAAAMDRSRGKWFLRPGRKALEIRGRIGLRRRRGGGGRV